MVKEHLKLEVPGPGGNPIGANFYDVQRDTREEYPVSTEIGAWGGAEFVRIIQRHMATKQKYPSEDAARGMPYDGIENLRPESKAAVKAFLIKNKVLMEAMQQKKAAAKAATTAAAPAKSPGSASAGNSRAKPQATRSATETTAKPKRRGPLRKIFQK